MMKYLFLPIEQHSDQGFGILANEYKMSADKLLENSQPTTLLEALPACFLYRHSSELYLKSSIIILHQVINKPFEKKEDPVVFINGKNYYLFNIHSLKVLFEYFSILILENESVFKVKGKTDWTAFPRELTEGINEIEKFDNKSSYYRYPNSTKYKLDVEKSHMEKIPLSNLTLSNSASKGSITMLYIDEEDRATEAYRMNDDSTIVQKKIQTLKDITLNLSGASTGLRVEYLQGY